MSTSEPTAPPRAPATAFEVAERVRWADVDLVGIVRYSAYTRFLDVAEAELLRAAGLSHPDMLEAFGVWLVRRVLHLEYHAPARYDVLLRVRAWVGRVGRSSLTLHFEICDEADAVRHATGHLVLVTVDASTMASRPLPADIPERLTAYRDDGRGA